MTHLGVPWYIVGLPQGNGCDIVTANETGVVDHT